jgi:transposase, IS605 orfB family
MLISYKTEIDPTSSQIDKINKTLGICRFLYNAYISENIEAYRNNKSFITGYDFAKYVNNILVLNNLWIKDAYSKARKKAIMNAETAFKNFFKGKAKFPKFKKKNKCHNSFYFVKNSKTDCIVQRHRIKIPSLGFVSLKEKGYIPVDKVIKSGYITKQANKYFVSVIVDIDTSKSTSDYSNGLGIDLGLKEFAVLSTGKVYKNINKSRVIRNMEKRLKREQKRLSKKYENKKKGVATLNLNKNIHKKISRIQKLHYRLSCIRTDYINKIVNEVVKNKPQFIAIENLNITGMMKNRHLSKAISNQRFYEFRTKLINKAKRLNIEIRLANTFYPSSKLCSCCGNIKHDLKLKDRIYKCNYCNLEIDRDYNASLNLMKCQNYKLA